MHVDGMRFELDDCVICTDVSSNKTGGGGCEKKRGAKKGGCTNPSPPPPCISLCTGPIFFWLRDLTWVGSQPAYLSLGIRVIKSKMEEGPAIFQTLSRESAYCLARRHPPLCRETAYWTPTP